MCLCCNLGIKDNSASVRIALNAYQSYELASVVRVFTKC